MTTIKTPDQLGTITSIETNDLICVWDVDEVSDEKMKTISSSNLFNNVILGGTLTLNSTALSSTFTELNQLAGVTVGGTTPGDIVDINSTQTLTNKALTYTSLNDGSTALTTTVDELNTVGERYYPDPSESDQGVTATGSGDTIYDIVTSVGTSKHAFIYLRHTGASNTTVYTFDTSLDLSSYPYVYFKFEPGAMLARTTGDEILTLYNSSNLIVKDRQQITSVDMLYFNTDSKGYPQWWGAKGDGSTDDSLAFQYCVNRCHITKVLPTYAHYLITEQGTVDVYDYGILMQSNRRIEGYGRKSLIKTNTDTYVVFTMYDVDYVTIEGVHVYGSYAGSGVSDVGGAVTMKLCNYCEVRRCYFGYLSGCVYVQVADSIESSNIKVNDNYCYNNGFQSITLTGDIAGSGTANLNGFEILNNRVYNNAYLTAICVQYGCTNGRVCNNGVHTSNEHGILVDSCRDITVTGNRTSYCTNGGITVAQTGATACENITVTGNTCTYCGSASPAKYGGIFITAKTGLMRGVEITGNVANYNHGNGISVAPTNDSTADMHGCNIAANYTAWNAYNGICLSFYNGYGVYNIAIKGNTSRANTRDGIYAFGAHDIDISNNTCTYNDLSNTSTYHGIEIAASCTDIVIMNNRLYGSVQTYGVMIRTGAVTTRVVYNVWFGNKTGTYSDSGTSTTITGNIV